MPENAPASEAHPLPRVGFTAFRDAIRQLRPRVAVVLGSGLGGVTAKFTEHTSLAFDDIPGLVPSTVHGHKRRMAVGEWAGVPALVCFGRLHFYEGHPWDVVTGTIRIAAELGVKTLILTNAAGGIHPSLEPGSLMAIRDHLKLLDPQAWRTVAERNRIAVYSPRLLQMMLEHESQAGRELLSGVYAALTGPSYETPAEIRALAACGADAVGMSTAKEAEVAAELGLEVAAISCITNRAAGLSHTPLDHAEVLANATLVAERLAELLVAIIAA